MKNRTLALGAIVFGSLLSAPAFAQSGGVSVPGILQASGSTGSKVNNSQIYVTNNKAERVSAGGGQASFKVGEVEMKGMANVNSVNVTGSTVKDSTIAVMENKATDINAIGGTANVNSVNIN